MEYGTSTAWYHSVGIRLPRACMSGTSVISWYHELLDVNISCGLRWRVASIGILLYWAWLTLYGKNISGAGQTLMGNSHPDCEYEESQIVAYESLMGCFAMYLLCKSVLIKPLWVVFNYNLTCFK